MLNFGYYSPKPSVNFHGFPRFGTLFGFISLRQALAQSRQSPKQLEGSHETATGWVGLSARLSAPPDAVVIIAAGDDLKLVALVESQSKPGMKTVYPEPCTGFGRRPKQIRAGTAPY